MRYGSTVTVTEVSYGIGTWTAGRLLHILSSLCLCTRTARHTKFVELYNGPYAPRRTDEIPTKGGREDGNYTFFDPGLVGEAVKVIFIETPTHETVTPRSRGLTWGGTSRVSNR